MNSFDRLDYEHAKLTNEMVRNAATNAKNQIALENIAMLLTGDALASDLSPRQAETALLMVRGLTSTEIAEELGISVHTVRDHWNAAGRKLGVKPHLVPGYFIDRIAREVERALGE